ncbi:MAG: thiamine pyrophosphate-binding protein [Anaerofustis sp.]
MKIKLSNYIADYITNYGIKDVFTVTGGGAMHLNDAFGHHEKLNCTYNHHEQASAMAAEAYARLTGELALVCVTSGPGGTNTLTGVMGAWVDSIPMIIISGQVKFSTTIKSTDIPLRQLGDQEFNIVDCVSCMTKYAFMVTEPNEIRYHLEKALYLAINGRPGPVWLDIPLNVQAAIIDTDELITFLPQELNHTILPPKTTQNAINVFVDKISNAKRPVILAGGGIRIGHAYEEFLEVIKRMNIPVITAWNAHDLLWDEHPLYCGRPGTVGTRGGNFVVQNSDLLISFACRMNIRQISYNWENFAKGAYKIAVDIDNAELQKPTLNIDMPIHADIKEFLNKILANNYVNNNSNHAEWLEWCKTTNKRYPAVIDEYYNVDTPVNPYVFMEKLSEHLNENEVIVTGNGSACVCSFQAMHIKKGERLFTNSGCASMGYGLPAALGAAIALKGKRVICLDGDGSIQMNLQELQTIIHNRLNLIIFWLNNDGYHSIRQTQTNLFDGNFCGVSKDNGVCFPSAEKIASAYGYHYVKIEHLSSIDSGIENALSKSGPLICEVVLDPKQFFEPKLSSKIMPDGTTVSPTLEDMYPFLTEDELNGNIY